VFDAEVMSAPDPLGAEGGPLGAEERGVVFSPQDPLRQVFDAEVLCGGSEKRGPEPLEGGPLNRAEERGVVFSPQYPLR